MRLNGRTRLRALCECGVLIAAAQVLGYLKLFRLPQGGSVTLNMLPVFIICARWGFGYGMLSSFAFSLLQLFLDGGAAIGWESLIGDYILAYSLLGLAGLFHRRKGGLYLGAAAGGFGRFLASWVTGATVWGKYMPEEFFGMTMTSPWIYSALYNGSVILISVVLCLILLWVLDRSMGKILRGEDISRDIR